MTLIPRLLVESEVKYQSRMKGCFVPPPLVQQASFPVPVLRLSCPTNTHRPKRGSHHSSPIPSSSTPHPITVRSYTYAFKYTGCSPYKRQCKVHKHFLGRTDRQQVPGIKRLKLLLHQHFHQFRKEGERVCEVRIIRDIEGIGDLTNVQVYF